MTAETLTATRAASTFPVFKANGSGIVCAAYGTYAIAANVEDGDIFEMCRVPAGAVILGGFLYAADIDTGTEALDMDVGWAANGGSGTYDSADPDGLGNMGIWTGDPSATSPNVSNLSAETGTVMLLSGRFADGLLPTFTEETVIQIEANAPANSFTAGSVSLVVFYVVP